MKHGLLVLAFLGFACSPSGARSDQQGASSPQFQTPWRDNEIVRRNHDSSEGLAVSRDGATFAIALTGAPSDELALVRVASIWVV
jgi:hypothetical protein